MAENNNECGSASFWGLVVESNRLYSQTVPAAFKLSMAALGPVLPNTNSNNATNPAEVDSSEAVKSKRSVVVLRYAEADDYALCTLTPGLCDQQPLDLVFEEGEKIALRIVGDHAVHLTGYYLPHDTHEHYGEDEKYMHDDSDSDLEYDSEDDTDYSEDDDETEESEEEDASNRIKVLNSDSEEQDAADVPTEEDDETEENSDEELEFDEDDEVSLEYSSTSEEEEEKMEPVKGAKRPAPEQEPLPAKKPQQPESVKPAPAKAAEVKPKATDVKQSPQAKQPEFAKNEIAKKEDASVEKKTAVTLPSGVSYEDSEVGTKTGSPASDRSTVSLLYKGKLASSGKVFDSNFKNRDHPLKFTIGSGQVIKGLEEGVKGMLPGGRRTITIPSKFAYGPKGAPPQIPPNATLVFEVEMCEVSGHNPNKTVQFDKKNNGQKGSPHSNHKQNNNRKSNFNKNNRN